MTYHGGKMAFDFCDLVLLSEANPHLMVSRYKKWSLEVEKIWKWTIPLTLPRSCLFVEKKISKGWQNTLLRFCLQFYLGFWTFCSFDPGIVIMQNFEQMIICFMKCVWKEMKPKCKKHILCAQCFFGDNGFVEGA